MLNTNAERDLHQPTSHRDQASEHRRLAERLARDGYRDQAARHLLEARLLDLKAAAMAASSRAA